MKIEPISYNIETKYIDNEPYFSAQDVLYMFKEIQEMLEVEPSDGGYYCLRAHDIELLESSLRESVINNLENYLDGD
jgi:hypothetical protein